MDRQSGVRWNRRGPQKPMNLLTDILWLLYYGNITIMEGMDRKKDPLGNGMFWTIVPPQ